MRLPWPFTLLKRAPAAEAAAAPSSRAGSESRAGDEWRQLPPITEAIGPPPLIAPTAPFAADLGAGKPPPPALAPLSHARGLDAPSGIILGVARPVQRVADSGTRPLLQRRPARNRASLAADAPPMEPPPSELVAQQPGTVADAPLASVPLARPRRLVVAMTEAQRPPAKLARLSERDSAALPVHAGVVGQATADTGSASAVALPMPSPATRSPILSLPPAQSTGEPDRTIPLLGPISRKPQAGPRAEAVSSPIISGRPTLGRSRRLGLGSPLAALPATARPVAAGEGPTPLPLSDPTTVQRKAQEGHTAPGPVHDKAASPLAAVPAVASTAVPAVASTAIVARPIPATF